MTFQAETNIQICLSNLVLAHQLAKLRVIIRARRDCMLLNVHPSGICHFYPPLPPCPTPQQLWFIKLWLQYVRLSASWGVETSADQED